MEVYLAIASSIRGIWAKREKFKGCTMGRGRKEFGVQSIFGPKLSICILKIFPGLIGILLIVWWQCDISFKLVDNLYHYWGRKKMLCWIRNFSFGMLFQMAHDYGPGSVVCTMNPLLPPKYLIALPGVDCSKMSLSTWQWNWSPGLNTCIGYCIANLFLPKKGE